MLVEEALLLPEWSLHLLRHIFIPFSFLYYSFTLLLSLIFNTYDDLTSGGISRLSSVLNVDSNIIERRNRIFYNVIILLFYYFYYYDDF